MRADFPASIAHPPRLRPEGGSGPVVKAESLLVSIPFAGGSKLPWSTDAEPAYLFDTLLVRLETEGGLVGWGEVFSRNQDVGLKHLIDTRVLPLVIGKDARAIGKIKHDLEFELQNFGRIGAIMYGISAVDVALWDIFGKSVGAPLVDLLGGPFAQEVEAYASLLPYGSPQAVADATRKAVELGYRYVKLHETELPEIRAAVEAAGDEAQVMLDVNCPWSVAQALAMDRRLAPLGLMWLEEPVWPPENYRGLARVRAEKNHLIAAGENAGSVHDFAAMIDAGAIDIAQPDVAKTGGVTELMKIAALCEASAIEFIPHCAMFGPGQVATLHINAAQRGVPLFERFFIDFGTELLFGTAMVPERGRVKVPRGPGLGIEPDGRILDRYRVA